MKAMLLFAVVILMSYGLNQYQKSIAGHAPVAASVTLGASAVGQSAAEPAQADSTRVAQP